MSGRAHASARYVSDVLVAKSLDLLAVLHSVVGKLTKPPEGDIPISPKESLYVMLTRLFEELESHPRREIIRRTFRNMCASYALTGQPQRFPDMDDEGKIAVEFIEQGICRVATTVNKGLAAVVDEQLVLIAACNFFGLESYQWEMLGYAADEPSSMSFQFERSLMLAIESEFFTLFGRAIGKPPFVKGHAGIA